MAEMREGYKMTELGEVPSDWDVFPLKKIFDINLTNASSPITNRECPEFNDYYKEIWQVFDHEI